MLDFSGTTGVHEGNLNATPAIVHSVTMYVMRLLVDVELPAADHEDAWARLVDAVVDIMGDAYPELVESHQFVRGVLGRQVGEGGVLKGLSIEELVDDDDLVVVVKDDGTVGHRVRRAANLLDEAAVLPLCLECALALVVVAREHLLPGRTGSRRSHVQWRPPQEYLPG